MAPTTSPLTRKSPLPSPIGFHPSFSYFSILYCLSYVFPVAFYHLYIIPLFLSQASLQKAVDEYNALITIA